MKEAGIFYERGALFHAKPGRSEAVSGVGSGGIGARRPGEEAGGPRGVSRRGRVGGSGDG